jgi:hypothetical protein
MNSPGCNPGEWQRGKANPEWSGLNIGCIDGQRFFRPNMDGAWMKVSVSASATSCSTPLGLPVAGSFSLRVSPGVIQIVPLRGTAQLTLVEFLPTCSADIFPPKESPKVQRTPSESSLNLRTWEFFEPSDLRDEGLMTLK